jgi:hypothetical protein
MTAALKVDISKKEVETHKPDGADTFKLSRQALISLVRGLIAGYPDPEDSGPLGPWGPVMRKAVDAALVRSGPSPDPWRAVRSPPHPDSWRSVALNPQPLPSMTAVAMALAEEVADRAALIGQSADAAGKGGNAGSNYIKYFVDDWCLTGVPKWPQPKRDPIELLTIGTTFLRLAESVGDDEGLRQSLTDGGETMLRTAVAQF